MTATPPATTRPPHLQPPAHLSPSPPVPAPAPVPDRIGADLDPDGGPSPVRYGDWEKNGIAIDF